MNPIRLLMSISFAVCPLTASSSYAQPLIPAETSQFRVAAGDDRLLIFHMEQQIAEYVFRDSTILRPYFAGLCTNDGIPVSRNHPPVVGNDDTDHDTMHPGLWMGFGDFGGSDFWRNKGRISHLKFLKSPTADGNQLSFDTESEVMSADGMRLCLLISRFVLLKLDSNWLLSWEAEFHSNSSEIAFGDQEEMGFGARVATQITEKRGGQITSSAGLSTATATWGQPAAWCDYSGQITNQPAGITLMAASDNFRESWWHNRDYGVFVANPFGRAAMKQGDASRVPVTPGTPFRMRFGACIHSGVDYKPASAFERFDAMTKH
jgi:hypothetical protein